MKAPRIGNRLAIGVLAALAPLLLPAVAAAQLVATEPSEPPPGITVRGIGLARVGPVAHTGSEARGRAIDIANSTAAARAVGDARLRAKEIARALGVQAGRPIDIDLRDESSFGFRRSCRELIAKDRSRCRQATLTATAASVTFAIVDATEGSPGDGGIQARGIAAVAVEPTDPKRNRPIKRAVLAARTTATFEAAAAAHRNAKTAADSARLELGPLVSISETGPSFPFELFIRDRAVGTFGPGVYCGFSTRPAIRRDPKTGKPIGVRRVRFYRCRVPREYGVSFDVRYATAG